MISSFRSRILNSPRPAERSEVRGQIQSEVATEREVVFSVGAARFGAPRNHLRSGGVRKGRAEGLTILDLSHLLGDLADDLEQQADSRSAFSPTMHLKRQLTSWPANHNAAWIPGAATSRPWGAPCTQRPGRAGAPGQTDSQSDRQADGRTDGSVNREHRGLP